MLVQWIGDQSMVMSHVLKFSAMTVQMVAHEFHFQRRVKPRLRAMRMQYPDVRLDISGNFKFH